MGCLVGRTRPDALKVEPSVRKLDTLVPIRAARVHLSVFNMWSSWIPRNHSSRMFFPSDLVCDLRDSRERGKCSTPGIL